MSTQFGLFHSINHCRKSHCRMQCADLVPVLLAVLGVCVLQAYDQHLNMILGDVEETITTVEVDDETYEEIIKVKWAGGGGERRGEGSVQRQRRLRQGFVPGRACG